MGLTTVTPAHLTNSQLTTAPKLLYTCPANTFVKITAATCTNILGQASSVTLHYVPAGGVTSTATQVVSGSSVAGNSSYNAQELVNHILTPGDQIWGNTGTGGSINTNISGVQFS
jgi:hypothetical protein